jgi:hypothetical protein
VVELVKGNNFSIYHFAEKRCLIPKKKNGEIFHYALRHQILQWPIEISANMKKTSIFIQKTCFNAEIEIQINLPVSIAKNPLRKNLVVSGF